TRQNDEIGLVAGFLADALIGNDQRGAGRQQLGNAVGCVRRDLDPVQRFHRSLRRHRRDGDFAFLAPALLSVRPRSVGLGGFAGPACGSPGRSGFAAALGGGSTVAFGANSVECTIPAGAGSPRATITRAPLRVIPQSRTAKS